MSGTWLALLVLVALAVMARQPTRRTPRPGTPAGLRAWLRRSWADRGRVGRRGWVRRAAEPDLGLVLTEVASRLRAGAPTDVAWEAALRRAELSGELSGRPQERDAARSARPGPGAAVPAAPVLAGLAAGASTSGVADPGVPGPVAALARQPVRDPAVGASWQTVVAACRLTHEVGAPMAQVLDRCAQSITEAREAHDARRVAMAAPAATARILAVLPVIGLLLGVALGADPVAVALDGGWGTMSAATGLVLVAVGRWWTTSLVAAARDPAGSAGRSRSWWGRSARRIRAGPGGR
ncbi:type II secretion system F family protein [Georgenia sunbinii]|uniref:type II secretion system F family protein n=1 Tax=Georgenia sunbinii TaxID=3117728 RepID=UPI002F26856F